MPLTDMAHTIESQRDLPQDYCRALVVEFKSRHEKAVNLWFQPGGKPESFQLMFLVSR